MNRKSLATSESSLFHKNFRFSGNTIDVPKMGAYRKAVRVIATRTLNRYAEAYPDAANAIYTWHQLMKQRDYEHFPDIKSTVRTADSIKDGRVVFNIKGNNYRLIVDIDYKRHAVRCIWFGRHKEYDKINAAEVTYDAASD